MGMSMLKLNYNSLTALHDSAAIGSSQNDPHRRHQHDKDHLEQNLIERRYTKPCARFLNGVRVGFGFVFERTCRPWNCDRCGGTDKLLHRQCRIFDFKRHQEVTLRSAEAVKRDEERLGRVSPLYDWTDIESVDSYEGFRSDYIHFSVSLVGPTAGTAPNDDESVGDHNSLHFSPKAFAHFFAWWK